MDEKTNIPNNAEIDKALKEFETKSVAEGTPKDTEAKTTYDISNKAVEGVKFETDSYKAVKFYNETAAPKIVRLVMKYSGLKEERHADYVLFGFVIAAIAVSLFLFFFTGSENPLPPKIMDDTFNQTIKGT